MGVGVKRFRGVSGRGRDADADAAPAGGGGEQHTASLGDEVRATRDPEYAADARRAAKRRRAAPSGGARAANGSRGAHPGRGGGRAARGGERVAVEQKEEEKNGVLGDVASRAGGAEEKEEEEEEATRRDPAMDARTTDKILRHARKQRDEIREEELEGLAVHAAAAAAGRAGGARANRSPALDDDELTGAADSKDSSDSDEDSDEGEGDRNGYEGEDFFAGDIVGVETADGAVLTPADELALAMFAGEDFEDEDAEGRAGLGEKPGGPGPGRLMLADIILDKIREKAEQDAAVAAAAADPEAAAREQKIAHVYGIVGNILAKYKSGRVPKAFKIIPKLQNWEHLMYLTRPDEWSPAACYAATRLLASNLHARDVVRFYSDVLLPRVLQDISENKKLNYHLYRALQKAVYKPDAFNKGILFPLCQAGGCTLREATVIGSVLSRVSIPMLHSAAALLYIAEQPYALSNSVFIHSLLDKKYSLPYRVIDALVAHFTRMKSEQRTLPLVWHISLLTFARRYKTEMESHQKDDLKLLMRVQTHPKVTPEIRRELFSARSRGEVIDPDANTIARAIASAS